MLPFLQGFFAGEYLPHGWCYRWDSGVVWLHVVSDLLIALAYYMIPFSLGYIVRRRSDLVYPWMFWLFAAFILACGTTHLMNVFVIWYPWYRFDGVLKLFTGVVSVATALLMMRVAPEVVKLPSHEEVRRINRQLEQEIAERKAAEQEVRQLNAELERRVEERTAQLRESENRMRAILDSSPALVYLKDLDGKFLFVNRQLAELTQHSREELIGKTGYDIFPEDLADGYRHVDEEVAASGQALQVEELALDNGQPRTFMSVKFPLTRESGDIYAICGISTDITERKKSEQELRRYNSDLEQFAHVVSHDLQEPLRTVKSYAQLLSRRYRGQLDTDADEFIDFITGGVNRMHELVAGLQTYSELNRPRHSPDEGASADAVLESTTKHMETSIRESSASITWDPLPQVQIPRAQLGQLFQNLISNAIKYSKPGVPPVIHIKAERKGREWEFEVSDNGIGMDMQYAEQIFGVFRRLHGRDIPGTGIGLAICKKVVESAGGRIWVVSQPGLGSRFYFTLPAA